MTKKSKTILKVLLVLGICMFAYNKCAQPSTSKTTQTGHASWYSKKSPGINLRTANNEIFNDEELTCAMWDVPFDQKIKITNLENGRSVVVRVNDRGPHKRFVRKGRIVDLSKKAFHEISALQKGIIEVKLEFL